MRVPSCEDLFDDDSYVMVHREVDDSWRHGCYVREVHRREEDGTFWMAAYEQSTDGETNGLRDGHATITQVYPHTVIVTKYGATPQKGE